MGLAGAGSTCVMGQMYSTGARPSRSRRGARPALAACMASSWRFMAASCASCARNRAACSCACFACAPRAMHLANRTLSAAWLLLLAVSGLHGVAWEPLRAASHLSTSERH